MTSPERRSAMAHPVVWFVVLGHNGERLRQFYGGVFGWRFDVENPMKYGMVDTGEQRGIPGGVGAAYPGARSCMPSGDPSARSRSLSCIGSRRTPHSPR
jgi:predicted enzyme related to lactoylglutathione lyase